MDKIKVMVVDDSAIVRRAFSMIIESSNIMENFVIAQNPIIAVQKINSLGYPDVLILDLEMPEMDGLTFLKQIMEANPLPVIVCSVYAGKGNDTAMEALEMGAIDIIEKPKFGVSGFIQDSEEEIIRAIEAASKFQKGSFLNYFSKLSKIKKPTPIVRSDTSFSKVSKIAVIGSSTGGVKVLETIIQNLSGDIPPVLIVQHMPVGFTKSLANRLNKFSNYTIKEANNEEILYNNTIYIAPGGMHMSLEKRNQSLRIITFNAPKINHHRPSVDILFNSAAENMNKNVIGIILTGMGNDGAKGLKEISDKGGNTFAQNEESCAVYGMPKEAIDLGAVKEILDPVAIAKKIKI
ncbi:MAG: chemotaxis response regulator protein-glutamate methylesterase [Candidatus Delongbacteria bacterium]|nr:chemotaxis response regulator protein-glutamate methylesterase [Candidatus Delongbacteria bacterium]MBN2833804.1 chemotaxis response regulator protein-glutamate methylesterase [Candidatus Delongbacteria bacterium]